MFYLIVTLICEFQTTSENIWRWVEPGNLARERENLSRISQLTFGERGITHYEVRRIQLKVKLKKSSALSHQVSSST